MMSSTARRVTPLRIALSAARVTTVVVGGHDPGVGRGAFGDPPVAVDLPGFVGAGLARLLLAEHVGDQRDRFDVAALPADIRDGDDRDAVLPSRGSAGRVRREVTTSVGFAAFGKAWSRGAAPRVTCR